MWRDEGSSGSGGGVLSPSRIRWKLRRIDRAYPCICGSRVHRVIVVSMRRSRRSGRRKRRRGRYFYIRPIDDRPIRIHSSPIITPLSLTRLDRPPFPQTDGAPPSALISPSNSISHRASRRRRPRFLLPRNTFHSPHDLLLASPTAQKSLVPNPFNLVEC